MKGGNLMYSVKHIKEYLKFCGWVTLTNPEKVSDHGTDDEIIKNTVVAVRGRIALKLMNAGILRHEKFNTQKKKSLGV